MDEDKKKQKAKLYRQRSYLKSLVLSGKQPKYKCDEVFDFYLKIKNTLPNLLDDLISKRKKLATEFEDLHEYLTTNNILEFEFYIKKNLKKIDNIELNTSIQNEQLIIDIFKEIINEIKSNLETEE